MKQKITFIDTILQDSGLDNTHEFGTTMEDIKEWKRVVACVETPWRARKIDR